MPKVRRCACSVPSSITWHWVTRWPMACSLIAQQPAPMAMSTTSFIGGGICPYPTQTPSQLETAVAFLKTHPGKVSPVTLDIGSNDMLPDLIGCTASSNFGTDLARLDNNLTQVILPQLRAALTVNGRVTGSIVMMNYYNPFPNCLASAQFTQAFNEFNTHLATDVSTFGFIVDVLGAFGGYPAKLRSFLLA